MTGIPKIKKKNQGIHLPTIFTLVRYTIVEILQIILFLVFSPGAEVIAQNAQEITTLANTAESAAYLSPEEKKVIFYTNLVRLDPKGFALRYLKPYLDTCRRKFKDSYVSSLKKDLGAAEPLSVLSPQEDLTKEARDHAIDMGKTGMMGHSTSSGKRFKERFKSLGKQYGWVGENCDYGNPDGLSIVMSLLIDENVSDLAHRKNILNPAYFNIGVSIYPHKTYRQNCVTDFGGRKNSN